VEGFVAIGEVVKALGLRGEVKLYPLLDFWPDLLDSRFLVWKDGTPAEIASHRPAGACEALTLAGAVDRSAAEALVGRELGFRREAYAEADFPKPPRGLPFRWLGRPVVTAAGEAVGTVTEVRFTGAGHTLVIADPVGRAPEILVPAVPPILAPEDDLEGDLVIDPPEGLLDVQSR
jgi:16S rRNA processing protein RimM